MVVEILFHIVASCFFYLYGIKGFLNCSPEDKRTLATLLEAEFGLFGFFGVIVEKLTDKSPSSV